MKDELIEQLESYLLKNYTAPIDKSAKVIAEICMKRAIEIVKEELGDNRITEYAVIALGKEFGADNLFNYEYDE